MFIVAGWNTGIWRDQTDDRGGGPLVVYSSGWPMKASRYGIIPLHYPSSPPPSPQLIYILRAGSGIRAAVKLKPNKEAEPAPHWHRTEFGQQAEWKSESQPWVSSPHWNCLCLLIFFYFLFHLLYKHTSTAQCKVGKWLFGREAKQEVNSVRQTALADPLFSFTLESIPLSLSLSP